MGIVIKLSKPILNKVEIRFLKNWLSLLVLVAFVRLQFVCCCGSIDHGHFESLPCISQTESNPAEVKSQCTCSHHLSKSKGTERTRANLECGCQLCNHDHSHPPHLATEHLQLVSTPNVNLMSLVVDQSSPIFAVAGSNCGQSQSLLCNEKCLHNSISILCKFGHLRI